MAPLRPAQVVRAKVTAVAPHGLHLKHGDVEIVVHITDVPWGHEVAPDEYARVGDELDVTVLRVAESGEAAAGWLPWPPLHVALDDLALERAFVVYPGASSFPLHERVEALALSDLPARLSKWR